MLPLRRTKAAAFPHRQPNQPSVVSSSHTQTRSSSLGRLLHGDPKRVVGGQFRRTNDSTVKYKGNDGFEEEGVLVEHEETGEETRDWRKERVVNIRDNRTRPTSLHVDYFTNRPSTSTRQPVNPDDYYTVDMSPIHELPQLSRALEHDYPARTKLSHEQIANFRKVSARRATLPAGATIQTEGVNASHALNKPLPPSRPVVDAHQTPKAVPPIIKAPGPTIMPVDPFTQVLTRDHSPTPPLRIRRPGHSRAKSSDQTDAAGRPELKSYKSTPPSDRNRPLPPLPAEAESPKTRFGIKLKRKSVPADKMITDEEVKIDTEPFSASKYIREALEISKENQRKTDLQAELDRAVAAQGKALERVESALLDDLAASFHTDSSGSSGVHTPAEEKPDTSRDYEMALQYQAVLDHMEQLHLKHEAEKEQVEAFKDANEIVFHLPGERRPQFTADADNKLGHVQSVRAQIESTTPTSTPPKFKLPGAGLLRASRTGPAVMKPAETQPAEPSALYGRVRPLVKQSTVPLGSAQEGQLFIPSGRSFEAIRAAPTGPRAERREGLSSANDDHPDIQELRKALKPVLTGDRVRRVIEGFEYKASGIEARPSSPVSPATPSSPLSRAIGAILERERLTRSNELSRETKQMMADARRQRKFHIA